ncbi:MAG TPA: GtrA family protein [Terriglobia bacterium]|nr:GtrA family protein [Terriglobia bacterium]
MIRDEPQSRVRGFTIHRYIAVGVFNTLIGLGIALLLSSLGVHYAIAISVAYVIGFVVSFFLNRYFTFRSTGKIAREFAMFAASTAAAFALNEGLAWFFVNVAQLSDRVAIVLSVGVAALVGYVVNKMIVFKHI